MTGSSDFRTGGLTKQDVDAVAELLLQLGYLNEKADIAVKISRLSSSDKDLLCGSYDGDRLAGIIHASVMSRLTSPDFIEIVSLVIDKEYRRRGLGRGLVSAVIKWAEGRGIGNVRVRCNKIRLESHEFYRSIGFTEKKEQKVFEADV